MKMNWNAAVACVAAALLYIMGHHGNKTRNGAKDIQVDCGGLTTLNPCKWRRSMVSNFEANSHLQLGARPGCFRCRLCPTFRSRFAPSPRCSYWKIRVARVVMLSQIRKKERDID